MTKLHLAADLLIALGFAQRFYVAPLQLSSGVRPADRTIAMTANVRDFYRQNADRESTRFGTPLQRIEFASTLRLIDTYFPNTRHICDIGSGPGRYALELAPT